MGQMKAMQTPELLTMSKADQSHEDQPQQPWLDRYTISTLKAFNPLTQLSLHQYVRFAGDDPLDVGDGEASGRLSRISRSVLEVETFFAGGLKLWMRRTTGDTVLTPGRMRK